MDWLFEGGVFLAFGVTVLAGLSTGLGSALALFSRVSNKGFLSVALGFSVGVMLYISLVEILPKSQVMLSTMGPAGGWVALGAFLGGMVLVGGIDFLVPSYENPHEFRDYRSDPSPQMEHLRLLRTGSILAVVLAVHNFPEGLATFLSVLEEPRLGVPLALAIAIHNIPEGISVSVPIYYATGSKRKAFWYSFLSGLAEPLGALLGYLVLMPFLNEIVLGAALASVAGVMVFVCLDQLLPSAREYGRHHMSMWGVVGGMALMAGSLLLLG
jgi:ZIP family zinc transporter